MHLETVHYTMRLNLIQQVEPASKEPLSDCKKCGKELDREQGYLACPQCNWVPQHGSD
jgi:Zn finger protein HypA/HybF involved in hydrogenase expression